MRSGSRAAFTEVSRSAHTEFAKASKDIDALGKDIQRLDRLSSQAGKRGQTELAASFKSQADVQRAELERVSQVAINAQGRIREEAVKTGAATKSAMTDGVTGASAAAAREGDAISRVFGNLRTQATQTGAAIKTGLTSGAFEGVGKKATLAGAGLLAAFAGLEKVTIGFDKTISRVGAVSDATASQLGNLRKAALDAGAATVFSASDAAEAEFELAKAGLSVGQVIGGLKGTLALAASDNLDLAEAATIAAGAMTQFALPASEVGHIADVLAAGANKSLASVRSLSEGLSEAGGVAAQAGFSLEDTVATLSLFEQNTLRGAEGGTALKTMLLRLIAPADKAATTMKDLGIQVYDATGAVRPARELFGELQRTLGPLSEEQRNQALMTIFGTRAIRGATIALKEGGAGWQKWRDAVRGNGEATKFAAANMDNLAGDIERLKGQIEVGLIGAGEGATPVLRKLAAAGESAAGVFSSLPGAVQGGAGVLLGLSGAALTAGGAMAVLVPTITRMRDGLTQLGPAGVQANKALGFLGRLAGAAGGVIGVAVAVDFLSTQLADITGKHVSVSKLTVSLLDLGDSLSDAKPGFKATGELADKYGTQLEGLLGDVKAYAHANDDLVHGTNPWKAVSLGVGRLSPQFKNVVKDVDAVDQALAGMFRAGGTQAEQARKVWASLSGDFDRLGISAGTVDRAFNDTTDAIAESAAVSKQDAQAKAAQAAALGAVGGGLAGTAAGLSDVEGGADKAEEAVTAFKESIEELIGINTGAVDANVRFQGALADVRKAILENGTSLDVYDEKGRANISVVNDAARAVADHASAVFEQTSKTQGVAAATVLANQAFNNERQQLIDVAAGFLGTREKAEKYIDSLGVLKRDFSNVTTEATLNTAKAEAAAAGLMALYKRLAITSFGATAPRPPGVSGPTLDDKTRAKGGPVHRNTPYEVGEQGVEAFVPAIRKRPRQKSAVAKLAQTAEAQAREQLVTLGIAAPRQPPAERTVPLTRTRKGQKPRPQDGPGRPQTPPGQELPRRSGLRPPSPNERRVGAIERVVDHMRVPSRAKVSPLVSAAVEDREEVEKRARGGVVRGRPRLGVAAMLLGQHGPQLFVPPSDGVVVKASDTRQLLRAREPKQVEAILSRAGADRRTLAAVAPARRPTVGAGTPRRASGGPVRRSQPYTVGERGPEAFVSSPVKREGGGLTIQVGDTKVNVSANTQAHVKGVSEADVNKIVARNQQRLVAELAQLVEKGQR